MLSPMRTMLWRCLALTAILAAGCDSTPTGDGGTGDGGALPPGECGDSMLSAGETCDDGNLTDGDGCDGTCQTESGFACTGEPSVCTADCGDGLVAASEGCDDGNDTSGDGCDESCNVEPGFACSGEPSVCEAGCGDGEISEAEECDDGDLEDGDGCSAACEVEEGFRCRGEPSVCTSAACGDGRTAGDEECDDGNVIAGDGCTECRVDPGYTCRQLAVSICDPLCGDGIVLEDEGLPGPGETGCDDGNTEDGDGCSSECLVEDGFTCEEDSEPTVCTADCGDGMVLGDETCDDANFIPSDGCTACVVDRGFACTGMPSVCTAGCGDGIVAGSEECDDGATEDGDGCSGMCRVESGYSCDTTVEPSLCTSVCGDGIFLSEFEACDDGNVAVDDGCDGSCAVEDGYTCSGPEGGLSSCRPVCGDGVAVPGEECDDNNDVGNDGCSPLCQLELGATCTGSPSVCTSTCGDGLPAWDEGCDDGPGPTNGDGCSATCDVEPGFVCLGAPSVCRVFCGDGRIDRDEVCDDGNGISGDGCSETCQPEFGFTCGGAPSVCTAEETLAQISLDDWGGCLRMTSGRLGCFGDNATGSVGRGNTIDAFLPEQVAAGTDVFTDVVDVSTGQDFACAVRSDGTVWCWGDNADRQIGSPSVGTDFLQPTRINGFPLEDGVPVRLVDVEAGEDFACATDDAQRLYCWGDNGDRQLGRGGTSIADSETPAEVLMPDGQAVIGFALGLNHACALLADLTVACWGRGDDLAVGGSTPADVSTATRVLAAGGSNFLATSVAAGGNSTCAIDQVGDLYCWGGNSDGQLADGTNLDNGTPNRITFGVVSPTLGVTMGTDFMCAFLATNEVYCWGEGNDYQLAQLDVLDRTTPTLIQNPPAGTVVALEAGTSSVCLQLLSGARWCWGNGQVGSDASEGQLGLAPQRQLGLAPVAFPGPVSDLTFARAEAFGVGCAVLDTGAIACFGSGRTLLTSTTVVAQPTGVLLSSSRDAPVAETFGSFTDVEEVALGDGFACVRTATGVECWGDNEFRQLGQGASVADSAVPLRVFGVTNPDEIDAGGQFACARTGSTVQCWGRARGNALGTSTTIDSGTPLTVMGLTDATQVALGEEHGCALRATGGVRCWGEGTNGQQGDGDTGDNATATDVVDLPGLATQVACGQDHSCALIAGEVYCWGENGRGQLGQGDAMDRSRPVRVDGLASVVELRAGWNHTCAVRSDGVVGCWGAGADGQLGQGGEVVAGTADFDQVQRFVATSTAVDDVALGDTVSCVERGGTWQCVGLVDAGQVGSGRTTRPTRPSRALLY
jgi:cysteine-rich repeat protein